MAVKDSNYGAVTLNEKILARAREIAGSAAGEAATRAYISKNVLNTGVDKSISNTPNSEGLARQYVYTNVANKPNTEEKKYDAYECVYTTLQQMHTFSSYTDVIYNDIVASARDIATNVAAIYTLAGTSHTCPTVMADFTIRSDLQKTEIVDSGTLQDVFPLPDGVLYRSGIRPGEDIAMMYAKSHLVSRLRDMYRGELIVRGMGCVKPYDIFYLADYQNKMYGIAEVGRVVHTLSPDTGFITSIKPDLVARQIETTKQWVNIHSGVFSACTFMTLKLLHTSARIKRAASAIYAARMAKTVAFAKNLYTSIKEGQAVASVMSKLSSINKIKQAVQVFDKITDLAAAAGAAVGSLPGAIVGFVINSAIDLAVTGLINGLVRDVENFVNNLNTVKIYPLFLKGKPFVAGITGAKYLIAYGSYDELVSGRKLDVKRGVPGQQALPNGEFLAMPSDRKGTITSYFGELRKPPVYDRTYVHMGVDIAFQPENAPITAVLDGTVSKVVYNHPSYGNYIVIDHGGGIQTLYAHLSQMLVTKGSKVYAGMVIGKQGSTGKSTGPHLHLELLINGRQTNILPYLPPICYK